MPRAPSIDQLRAPAVSAVPVMQSASHRGFFPTRGRLLPILCLLLACLCGGCAKDPPESSRDEDGELGSYRERLKATEAEFAYYHVREQNLSPTVWEREGISLRVPKPFGLLELPSQQNPAPGHAPSREILGIPLPGVQGLWTAPLPGESAQAPQTAYLFVMSNHPLWPRSRISAMAFHQRLVEDVLAELPGLSQFPIDADWTSEVWPGHGQPYTFATFQATLPETNAPADFTLYLFQHGANDRRNEIKVAVLFVIPQDAKFPGSQPDADPQKLSIETLRITPRPMDGS